MLLVRAGYKPSSHDLAVTREAMKSSGGGGMGAEACRSPHISVDSGFAGRPKEYRPEAGHSSSPSKLCLRVRFTLEARHVQEWAMAQLVVAVRHSETEWARAGRHTSRTDLPLTEAGRQAALALGHALGSWNFETVFASPRQRARNTALLALGEDTPLQTCDDLAEWDYGVYEGTKTAEIRESEPGWDLWTDGCPAGESPKNVIDRCDRMVNRLEKEPGIVACFAHGHILRALAARWMNLDIAVGRVMGLDTATISILGYEHENRALRQWNSPGTSAMGHYRGFASERRE